MLSLLSRRIIYFVRVKITEEVMSSAVSGKSSNARVSRAELFI